MKKSRHAPPRVTTDSTTAPPVVHDVLRSPGHPLDEATRGFMERRFDHDFSQVRVHNDAQASESADAVNATAYTVGRHVVFGAGQYQPSRDQGRELIAHELTHVLHQNSAEYAPGPLPVGRTDDATETDARATAAAVRAGAANAVAVQSGHALLRQPDPKKPQQPTPAQNYQTALTTIKQKDPEVFRYLAGTTLNAKSKVHSGTETDTTVKPPITIAFEFNLNVTSGKLAAGRDAAFTGGIPVFGGKDTARTFTADMTMEISSGVTSTPTAMAEALYHESIHMLLFIEDLIPSKGTKKHSTSMAGYRATAAASATTAPTLADLAKYMSADWTARKIANPTTPAKAAQEILDHIVEEKYAFDQELAQFGKGPTNKAIVDAYIKDGFTDMNVTYSSTDKTLQGVATGLISILGEIDQKNTAAKTTPTPTQKPQPQTPKQPSKP
jgi:Domain of unknown function (DUF4157)